MGSNTHTYIIYLYTVHDHFLTNSIFWWIIVNLLPPDNDQEVDYKLIVSIELVYRVTGQRKWSKSRYLDALLQLIHNILKLQSVWIVAMKFTNRTLSVSYNILTGNSQKVFSIQESSKITNKLPSFLKNHQQIPKNDKNTMLRTF